ncbi:MAG TPA: response regulator transcription factor [Saprospiraceae bacterium]|nr:response regulator transcription factor [Saprospiraceae bacterium]
MEIKVAIVDDHRLFRIAIVNGLSKYPDINIIFQAEDGVELMAKLIDNPVDVILLDMEMPKMDGMSTLKEIRKYNQDVKVIICTAHYEENEMLELIEEKANGYL